MEKNVQVILYYLEHTEIPRICELIKDFMPDNYKQYTYMDIDTFYCIMEQLVATNIELKGKQNVI